MAISKNLSYQYPLNKKLVYGLIVVGMAGAGSILWYNTRRKTQSTTTIQTVWGKEVITCPITQALLQSRAMQRIKNIDQSGACSYFGHTPFFTRYDHCIGVWALVRRTGASLKEQLAALLHDASHTVFSHVADHLFSMPEQDHSYQDTIHLWFLDQMGIPSILNQYQNISLEDLYPDNEAYKRLEQPLPNLCADRIEYIIHTGFLWGKLTQKEVDTLHHALHFDQETNRWYFTSLAAAQKFSQLSLYFTEYLWGAPWNCAFNTYFSDALKYALEKGIITKNEIHFGTDQEVLLSLKKSDHAYIQNRLVWCQNIHESFTIAENDQPFDILHTPKFRGVNPWVQIDHEIKQLCDIDPEYAQQFTTLKTRLAQGIKIILKHDI